MIGDEMLSDKNLWFKVKPSDAKSDLERKLIDLYNASVVQNSIMTDVDIELLYKEKDAEIVDAIKKIDVTEWRQLIERKQKEEEGLDEELQRKYDEATDFDARCIYALELFPFLDTECEYDFESPARIIMESLMKEKRYSLYLYEVWLTWRDALQSTYGGSRYSVKANYLYNAYRNICAHTIFNHIKQHPQDMKAINQFLAMAMQENKQRSEGTVFFGNQYYFQEYNLFVEK